MIVVMTYSVLTPYSVLDTILGAKRGRERCSHPFNWLSTSTKSVAGASLVIHSEQMSDRCIFMWRSLTSIFPCPFPSSTPRLPPAASSSIRCLPRPHTLIGQLGLRNQYRSDAKLLAENLLLLFSVRISLISTRMPISHSPTPSFIHIACWPALSGVQSDMLGPSASKPMCWTY